MLPVGFYFSSNFSLLPIEKVFLNLKKKLRNSKLGEVKAILLLFRNVLILLSFLSKKIIEVVLCVKLSNERRRKYVHMAIFTSLFFLSNLRLLLKIPFSANQATNTKENESYSIIIWADNDILYLLPSMIH